MRLYRILNEYELEKLKNNILTFKIFNSDIRNVRLNTFDYGNSINSPLAYKKHFFLTKEDAYTFNIINDSPEACVHVFEIPEEVVIKNIGFGNYGNGFNPLEVAISSSDFIKYTNLNPIPMLNKLEFLSMDYSEIFVGEEKLSKTKSIEFYNLESIWLSILKKFYTEEGCLSFDVGKRFFDDEKNCKMIVDKVKELVK